MFGVVQARTVPPAPGRATRHPRTSAAGAHLPDTVDALDALNVLRQAEAPMALVHDEYGDFDGILTPADILDAIAGAFRVLTRALAPSRKLYCVKTGSWLIAGWMPARCEMAETLNIALPEGVSYATAAGLVIDEPAAPTGHRGVRRGPMAGDLR